MQRLRILCPSDLTDRVRQILVDDKGLAHLVVTAGASLQPRGDLLEADVARESSGGLLHAVEALPGSDGIAITITELAAVESTFADRAERDAPGAGADAVVWEEVEARVESQSQLTFSFLALLVIAVLLATVGVLTDSSILVVGAMVVGPDFGPVSGLTLATVQRRAGLARQALLSLGIGFPVAILGAFLLTTVARHTSGLPQAYLRHQIPLTAFASHPDGWALVTALLAGVAGVVSITSESASALVGVAVSVTTVPAAGAVGAALAAGHWGDFRGALAQLAVNLVALFVAGVVSLGIRHGARRRRRHADD